MMSSRNFWIGVVAGAGGYWLYHRYSLRKSSS
jgi:hypothetical protein